jgi:N utilization substance protein A
MPIKLETETIRIIAAFERITGVHPKDCLIGENNIYFLVEAGKVGMAIGRNGSVIKEARRVFGKPIRLFAHSDTPEELINSIVPTKSIDNQNGAMVVSIQPKDRSQIIGRNGETIKAVREMLKRHFNISELKLRM